MSLDRWYAVRWAVAGASAAVFSTCDVTPTAPEALVVDAVVSPSIVRPGEQMTVTLTVVNPTADSLTLTSPHSCFALPEVWVGDERMAWEGTALGCLTVVTYHGVGPGRTLQIQWSLTARLQEEQAPWEYVIAPPAGRYRVVLDMEVPLRDIAREFEVRH